ncbi:hypothetical protein IAR55_003040 [Kwoniella newhampshirensis]|uniref:YTH domain-containing protein n=1 Tax=Kwoniella newhampshirensis TaxID=1651941 RepID=A0AAW0Z071_9TREE
MEASAGGRPPPHHRPPSRSHPLPQSEFTHVSHRTPHSQSHPPPHPIKEVHNRTSSQGNLSSEAEHGDHQKTELSSLSLGDQVDTDVSQSMQNLQIDQSSYRFDYSPQPLQNEVPYQPYAQAYTPFPQQQYRPTYQPYGPYPSYQDTVPWRPQRSDQPSPINPSHPVHSQPFGLWASPPMSPVVASTPFRAPHSRHGSFDEFGNLQGGRGYYNTSGRPVPSYPGPASGWTSPSNLSPFTYYTPFQQQPSTMESTRPPSDWNGSPVAPPLRKTNRMSWSGPSRPVRDVSPDKERERKAYHPQAPSRRSDWVIPSNTTHEELWRYFNMTAPVLGTDADAEPWRGPSSIFLISRSSCAFVNLSSQADLDRAVKFFNGRPLRPWDPRCPRMVCRVRRKDDDLRAGVGAQRGTGMHREWVKDQEQTLPRQTSTASTSSTNSVPPSPAVLEHPPDGEGRRRDSIVGSSVKHKSTGSFASTNSSFLAKHFPRRIFILKSLTTIVSRLGHGEHSNIMSLSLVSFDEVACANSGTDQAFRTSQEVFLIFGANRAGEFFGYAKMIEPIDKERAKKNHWSSGSMQKRPESENPTRPAYFLSPSQARIASSSPGEITPFEESSSEHATGSRKTDPSHIRNRVGNDKSVQSAPDAYRAQTLDPKALQTEYFPPVPVAAVQAGDGNVQQQEALGTSQRPAENDGQGVLRKDTILSPEEKAEREKEEAKDEFAEDQTGHTFRVEWVKVAPLPFTRTRHLRNPWNTDREVKVSRDGTEVEPNVGSQLMAEWDKAEAVPRFAPKSPGFPH